jgi:glutathione peroxidase
MRRLTLGLSAAVGAAGLAVLAARAPALVARKAPPVLNFTVKNIDGKDVRLADYAGKVLLVVNVASECGYTPQYAGLQQLHDKFKDKGLRVLGFPANNFGGQEPGTEAEIKRFCTGRYKVAFDLFAKVSAAGADIHPFFKHLTTAANPALKGAIGWNFEKFLINRKGELIARYKSDVEPDDDALVKAVAKALAEK